MVVCLAYTQAAGVRFPQVLQRPISLQHQQPFKLPGSRQLIPPGPVTQLVECPALNRDVGGSNPSWYTKKREQMTVSELGEFLLFMERVFGPLTMSTYEGVARLNNAKGDRVAQYTPKHTGITEVWVRMDMIPPEKKKEAEKELQSSRFSTIVTE